MKYYLSNMRDYLSVIKALRSIKQISFHDNKVVRAVGESLLESFTWRIPKYEKEAISLIEGRRLNLLKSNEKISVIDYGAGSPNANKTEEEMRMGIQSTALVSNICEASKSRFWATFLFRLIRKLKPSSCVELGTCVGISASYQAAALSLNEKGELVSIEGSPYIADIARDTFDILNLKNVSVVTGPFDQTLRNVLETVKPIDFFFNDGHHDHDAVIKNFNSSIPYLSDESIVILDDISWSPGMRKAWLEIENHDLVTISIDLRKIGIVLICRGQFKKEKVTVLL